MACIPPVSVWRCLLDRASPKQGVISYFLTCTSCLGKRCHSLPLFCASPSAGLNIYTWLRGTQTFFVACQFMSFPLFFWHFSSSFLRFQKIFIYWKHQLLSTVCILKVSPSMSAVFLIPLPCFETYSYRYLHHEVYCFLVCLPRYPETVGKLSFYQD